MRARDYPTPVRLFLITAISVGLGEVAVMFILARFPPLDVTTEAFVDGLMLAVLATPILYLFLFRPMVAQITERQRAEKALTKANEELETHVAERTSELSNANEQLRQEVADRQRSESKLLKNNAFIQNVVESAPFLILIYDAKSYRCSYVNGRIREFLGYGPEVVFARGKQFFESVLEPEDLVSLTMYNGQLVDCHRDELTARQFRMRNSKGELRPFVIRMSALSRDPSGAGDQILFSAVEDHGRVGEASADTASTESN